MQADVDFVVRTDLAIEERRRVWESGSEIAGGPDAGGEAADAGIRVTEVLVCDERGKRRSKAGRCVSDAGCAVACEEGRGLPQGGLGGVIGLLRGCLWIMGLSGGGWSGR